MDWLEIIIKVPQNRIETASAIANMTVPYGIYIEDYSDLEQGALEIAHIDLIDENLIAKNRDEALIHIYVDKNDDFTDNIEYLKERFSAEKIEYDISFSEASDIDWNEYWKRFFHSFEIGERLVIVPEWENYENNDNRSVLKINPGAAFGTGTHATTSLCLELLSQYTFENSTVLDIGSGSGILSIAGVLLGAKSSVGVDIDEAAVKVANANAVMNNVSDKTEYIHGDLAEKVSGKFDIVCANIVADVIIRLLSNISNFMHKDSVLIASGIIDSRAEDVKKAFSEFGFSIVDELTKDNWYAFTIKMKE